MHYKPPPGAVAALEWGRSHEDTAREVYANSNTCGETYQVERTGIHISVEHPWLAASPDGLVDDPSEEVGRKQGILEIKCPYSARTHTPEAACQEINRFYCNIVDGHVILKRTHNYYYQVQGQLAITRRPWCDFCVWSPHGVSVERINRDKTFWENKMFPKLKQFYLKYYLPEMADPMFPTGQPIRELTDITELCR